MHFNKHWHLEGQHAFLSASKYHWVNYDEEKLIDTYLKHMDAKKGTDLHQLAYQAIKLGVKLQGKNTLSLYVNDAIGFKMQPEQILYYSDNCFGTADTISFRRNLLRIHDLKNGATRASPIQLEIYAALFCLEYDVKPIDIDIELRIYQFNEAFIHRPEPEVIFNTMNKIIVFDKKIEQIKIGG